MNTLLVIVLVFLLGTKLQAQNVKGSDQPEVLSFMTYNIKFSSLTFEPSWEERRDMQVELIRKYDPDILGTQEGLKEQIDYLMIHLPEYIVVGEGRKGGDDDEHMAIFIKKDKFRLRELQSFQLSETPEIIGSGPEVNPRMVTWARLSLLNLTDESSASPYAEDYRGHWENTREFYVFNTHFFNGNQALARLNGARLVRDQIQNLERFGHWNPKRPVILMGDFNCLQGSPPHQVLVGNEDDPGILNETIDQGKDIDWILYNGDIEVLKYEEVHFNVDGVYPSDHKPIYVELKMFTDHDQ